MRGLFWLLSRVPLILLVAKRPKIPSNHLCYDGLQAKGRNTRHIGLCLAISKLHVSMFYSFFKKKICSIRSARSSCSHVQDRPNWLGHVKEDVRCARLRKTTAMVFARTAGITEVRQGQGQQRLERISGAFLNRWR